MILSRSKLMRRRTRTLTALLRKIGFVEILSPKVAIALRDKFGGARDAEIELLSRFVGKGDIAIDVGAHAGAYSFRLIKLVGSQGRVIAFEPQKSMADYLIKGLSHHSYFEFHNMGLGEANEFRSLAIEIKDSVPQTGGASMTLSLTPEQSLHEHVVIKSLDSFEISKVKFMKIDTEGFEIPVLLGARKTITQSKPIIFLEVLNSQNSEHRKKILNLFEPYGYRFYFVLNGQLTELTSQDFEINNNRQTDRSINFILSPTKL